VALGPPPAAALEAAGWAYRFLMMQAWKTAQRAMPDDERDKTVRVILRDAKGFMTDAARLDYMKMREDEQRQLEARRRRGRAAAPLEPVVEVPAGAEVIPIRRSNG
jgi:hypothetical protein